MIRTTSLFQTIFTFTFLALLALAGTLSARTPNPAPSASPASRSLSGVETLRDTHLLLYRKLCELNELWATRTPDFEILTQADFNDDEVTLIQTHLKLVLRQLRSADVGHLSDSQHASRLTHIETLQAYMEAGNFPQNVFVAGRRPVFIDPWGTHCAVGHLIAASGHSRLASTINHEHQLDFLRDIKTVGLLQWQHASGLGLDELALIQPTYRSTTLKYPKEIENLILGDSKALAAGVESGELAVDARCGGKTLLHFAAAAGDLDLVKLLVEKGADLRAVSSLGCDAAELAKGGKQMVVTVRWNESTSVTNRGGLGNGRYGPVFQTERGRLIADTLNDLRGGRDGLNALDYATEVPRPWGYYGLRYSKPIRPGFRNEVAPANPTVERLKKDRAAVAAWLEEQGLKVQ